MMDALKIFRNRTSVIPVWFSYMLGDDVYTSQIRTGQSFLSPLIATFTVVKAGPNQLTLMLDNSVTAGITHNYGYMDIKRVTGGEPVPVFEDPIPVLFKDQVTA